MDAFYEEDERILVHAADPYHRIDIRRSSRHLVVRDGDEVVADTHAPLVPYESGFAPRWYVRRADIVADPSSRSKGRPSVRTRASRRTTTSARHGPPPGPTALRSRKWSASQLISFYPEKVTITIDGEKLEPVPGQTVTSHGPDRNLSVDEIGGIQLIEDAVSAQA